MILEQLRFPVFQKPGDKSEWTFVDFVIYHSIRSFGYLAVRFVAERVVSRLSSRGTFNDI